MAINTAMQLPFNAERIKYYTDGTDYPDVTISGSGFGSPPNIVLYRDWSRDSLGNMSLVNNMVGPNFVLDGGVLTPKIFEAFGRNGVGNNEGGDDRATNNRRTTFVCVFPVPHKNYRIGLDLAVPTGRTFPGGENPGDLPNASTMKVTWLIDTQEGGPIQYADVCCPTWVGNFNLAGNNCPYNVGGTDNFDFDDWNYFQGSAVAGADPFVDNGRFEIVCSNSIDGTIVNVETDTPAFDIESPNAHYDRIAIHAWSGNGVSHDDSLILMSYIYVAMSDDENVNQRIELMNNSTFASATKLRLIPYKSWSDTLITFSKMPHYLAQGFTHYRITAGSNSIVGAL